MSITLVQNIGRNSFLRTKVSTRGVWYIVVLFPFSLKLDGPDGNVYYTVRLTLG
jgi:hypothetical protein